MGLIKAAAGAVGGALAGQWKEFFYCDSLPENVMAVKGKKRAGDRSSNIHDSDNVITSGSLIAVADGQCMIIVDQGKVSEICAEPGEFAYDDAAETTVFTGDLGESVIETFKSIGKRFTFGGAAPRDQRVYYFNTKELTGNKYGTVNPVPFRVVDTNIGLDMDISVRCFGEYSYRIVNPILFYTNVCGNIAESYTRDKIDGQLKTELMTALQPAFAKISAMGIRYSMLPGHTIELAEALNELLSAKWRELRGLEIVSLGVSGIKASDEDENIIKELQRNAAFRDPAMAAAHLVGAQAAAMQTAAANEGAGSAMAFMGMNMANQSGGVNAGELYNMNTTVPAPAGQAPPIPSGWTCSCGFKGNTGKFCAECGKPQPEENPNGWKCSCGAVNKGKFCAECGKPKPAGVPQFKCDKCGWEPADKAKPPKFCPECGDPFDDGDAV
ncbi:MAG: SPFH domain-containing protein [Clostridiales bacterium]|jgi:membrane protease subunit (stomatin/prohibitin family)|nr:SPFH domain-containing protein [Clostridiales bacterium]